MLDILNQFPHRQAKGLVPADLSQCGATLQYRASGDPVRQFVVSMNDMGYWLDALQATDRWVSGLDAEAKKARIGKGQATKL